MAEQKQEKQDPLKALKKDASDALQGVEKMIAEEESRVNARGMTDDARERLQSSYETHEKLKSEFAKGNYQNVVEMGRAFRDASALQRFGGDLQNAQMEVQNFQVALDNIRSTLPSVNTLKTSAEAKIKDIERQVAELRSKPEKLSASAVEGIKNEVQTAKNLTESARTAHTFEKSLDTNSFLQRQFDKINQNKFSRVPVKVEQVAKEAGVKEYKSGMLAKPETVQKALDAAKKEGMLDRLKGFVLDKEITRAIVRPGFGKIVAKQVTRDLRGENVRSQEISWGVTKKMQVMEKHGDQLTIAKKTSFLLYNRTETKTVDLKQMKQFLSKEEIKSLDKAIKKGNVKKVEKFIKQANSNREYAKMKQQVQQQLKQQQEQKKRIQESLQKVSSQPKGPAR